MFILGVFACKCTQIRAETTPVEQIRLAVQVSAEGFREPEPNGRVSFDRGINLNEARQAPSSRPWTAALSAGVLPGVLPRPH